MAEGRMLRKKISLDPEVAQLSDRAALLYTWAIPHLDVEGRLPGEPAAVRGTVAPLRGWTDAEIASCMREWTATVDEDDGPRPLVAVYVARGIVVCQFRGFAKNQRLRPQSEPPSVLPPPPEGLLQPQPAWLRGHLQFGPGANSRLGSQQEKLREEKRREEKRRETGAANAALPARKAPAADDPVREVYDHWRAARDRSSSRYDQISPKRREKIRTRLREFTVDDLKRAIDGVALDPWPERCRHDDLVVILRSREQVERFLAFVDHPPPRPSAAGGQAGTDLSARDILDQAIKEAS